MSLPHICTRPHGRGRSTEQDEQQQLKELFGIERLNMQTRCFQVGQCDIESPMGSDEDGKPVPFRPLVETQRQVIAEVI